MNTFCRNTWLTDFSKSEQDDILHQVQDICRPALYWNASRLAMGRKAEEQAAARGERGWGKTEGWSVMYVRLRGLAIKAT